MTLPSFRQARAQWGLFFIGIQILVATSRMLSLKVAMHYAVFSEPFSVLWRGENPYPLMYVSGNEEQRYLYSPTFAMFVFAPFSALPEFWGRMLFTLVSLLLLIGGFAYWVKKVGPLHRFHFFEHRWRNLAALLFGAELFGALYFTKVEMAQVGLLFFVLAWLADKKVVLAFLLLGFLAEFKFQMIPVIGLALVVAWLQKERPGRALLSSVTGFLVAALLPLLSLSWNQLIAFNQSRFQMMDTIVQRYWQGHYQPLYKFLLTAGVPLTFSDTGLIAAVGAVLFTAATVLFCRRLGPLVSKPAQSSLSYLMAVSLGLAFYLLFSPLSQSNAFVFLAPLYALILVGNPKAKSNAAFALLLASLFLASVIYSDLVPRALNVAARAWGAKPWGIIPLLIAAALVPRSIASELSEK